MIKWLKHVIVDRSRPALLDRLAGSKPALFHKTGYCLLVLMIVVTACSPSGGGQTLIPEEGQAAPVPATPGDAFIPSPMPTREPYAPGTLVDYVAQTGDTLPALAAHFNTTVEEIREANPNIPLDATTMPSGMPMSIPVYYKPLWGSSYQIIPDDLFVNGPAQQNFNAVDFVNQQPGWFKNYSFYLGDYEHKGGDVINYIADMYSVSPRLLLAILEYQTGALTNPDPPAQMDRYTLGYRDAFHLGAARQLIWAANILNNGYYSWRLGELDTFDHLNGESERPDPWQNAATVALQYYFSKILDEEAYQYAISGSGFGQTYQNLYGDPWANVQPHIPGSLHQPDLTLPYETGKTWAYTGGPHTGWGEGEPFAAVDFAPPTALGGCSPSDELATAMADGIVVKTGDASLVLDLDGDGDMRTGWVLFYLHLANDSLPKVGKSLKTGDPIGMPSCEGGNATGSHVHIARLYNGEWIPASAPWLLTWKVGW